MSAEYALYIANKNYSSWSLRSWVLLSELEIPFEERMVTFGDVEGWDAYRRIAPNGKVPCLIDGATVVWDSLAIAEYIAERHGTAWPTGREARAWARSAAAEMHSGFNELRSRCSMSCGIRIRLHEIPAALERDLARLAALWTEGLRRFGGPYLAGPTFTAADAFYAPVAFRIQSYYLPIEGAPGDYVRRLLRLKSMQAWYADALAETNRDLSHEAEILRMGVLVEDLRAK